MGNTPSVSRLLVRGKRYSAITALSLDGVLDTHITPNTVTGDTFLEFVETKLLLKVMPFDGVNQQSIIVMDNASIHHVYPVIEALEEAGCLLLFLPPYSPDLNPIEECFSKVKSQLRSCDATIQELAEENFPDLIQSAFDSVLPEDVIGWFKDSGYIM